MRKLEQRVLMQLKTSQGMITAMIRESSVHAPDPRYRRAMLRYDISATASLSHTTEPSLTHVALRRAVVSPYTASLPRM
jgi:hypothetical protein